MNLPHSSQKGKSWLWHALFFGLLLLIQVALVLFRDQPLVMSDEAVYLANARYLSGTAPMPPLLGAVYSATGYSVFLVPAFWLFENPHEVYTATLIISALLMSTLYFSLYYVLDRLFGISCRFAMLISFITCLYPPLLLRSNFAWQENAYVPGFLLLVVLFSILLRHKTTRSSLLFGVLLGYMYTIHSRSLPLIPISALFLVTYGLLRFLAWRQVITALTVTALIFIGTRLAIDHLKSVAGTGLSEEAIESIVTHLLSLQGLHDFILTFNQQVLYLIQSSYGLFLVGFLATVFSLWRQRRLGFRGFLQDVPAASLTFFLLIWFGSLVLSAAFLASPNSPGHLLMGRYVDGISAVFFALGLSSIFGRAAIKRGFLIFSQDVPKSILLYATSLAFLAISTLVAMYGMSLHSPPIIVPNSLGIYPHLALFGPTALAVAFASAIAAAGFVLLALVRGRLRMLAVFTIAFIFLLTSAYNFRFGILPLQERVARSTSLASYIRSYFGSPSTIAYDISFYHPLTYFTYEYLLPQTRLVPFDSAAGEIPLAPIVISGPRWQSAGGLGAQFWQVEPVVTTIGASQALWTLPGPQQSALLQQVDYSNTVLGRPMLPAGGIETPRGIPVQPVWALWQRSFYHFDATKTDTSLVWFDADAALHVPSGGTRPQAILLNLINPGEVEKPLQIDVNAETLFANTIPPGNWCEVFPLSAEDAGNIKIELSRPTRELLLVRGIALLDHVPIMHQRSFATDALPASGYRSQLALETPPYPQTLVRNTMGTVRINVTNSSDQVWPTSCEIGNSPGVVHLGILWFRKHSADRSLSARVAEGRAALPYALAPGRSLTLAAILAPFKQDGEPLSPGEYEVWIGPVQGGSRPGSSRKATTFSQVPVVRIVR